MFTVTLTGKLDEIQDLLEDFREVCFNPDNALSVLETSTYNLSTETFTYTFMCSYLDENGNCELEVFDKTTNND